MHSLVSMGIVCLAFYMAIVVAIGARQDDELTQARKTIGHLLAEPESRDLLTLRHKLDDALNTRADLTVSMTTMQRGTLYARGNTRSAGPGDRTWQFRDQWAGASSEPVMVDLQLDTARDDRLLRWLAVVAVIVALSFTLLSALSTSVLVRRGLRPLSSLRQQLANLSAAGISGPLHADVGSDELLPLVEQFNQLLQKLDEAYQQLEAFNLNVAHELRTPLAALIGQSEVALRRPRPSEQLADTIASNLEELHNMSAIVNDMLFLSRAERGTEARLEQVDSVAQLIATVVSFHEAAFDERQLSIAMRGDTEAKVDRGLFQRAVSNLLDNAARHADLGTQIEVEIRAANNEVTVVVINRGGEIEPVEMPRLFERFYRGSDSSRERSPGHGLGLAIVAAVARLHGGLPFVRSSLRQTAIGFSISQG